MPVKILLDTSALMIPGNFGVDIFTEIRQQVHEAELYTLTTVVKELEGLGESRGKRGRAASLALHLINIKGVRILSARGHVDRTLQQMQDFAVFTTDGELIKKLKVQHRRIIFLKERNRLGFYPDYWVEV